MVFVSSIDVIGSGFTTQQQRLDIISENIVNMNTTRTENSEAPYRRKVVAFGMDNGGLHFQDVLVRIRNGRGGRFSSGSEWGVRAVDAMENPSDFKLKYDPNDPDANENGYVELPNVDLVKEITDGMAARRAFSANVTAGGSIEPEVNDCV